MKLKLGFRLEEVRLKLQLGFRLEVRLKLKLGFKLEVRLKLQTHKEAPLSDV